MTTREGVKVCMDLSAAKIAAAFEKKGPGGVWQLNAAVKQPSC